MLFHICCYSKMDEKKTKEILDKIIAKHPEIFKENYLFMSFKNLNGEYSDVYEEIMQENNFESKSFFWIDWNNQRSEFRPRDFVIFMRDQFGEGNIMILYNNDTRVV